MITELNNLLKAGFGCCWISSDEPMECLRDVMALCDSNSYPLGVWDIEKGLSLKGAQPVKTPPNEAVKSIRALRPEADEQVGVLVMLNMHRQLNAAGPLQALQNAINECKGMGVSIVVIAPPDATVPSEISHMIRTIEPGMPSRDALGTVLDDVLGDGGEEKLDGDRGKILEAGAGLTRGEFENAIALSLTESGKVNADSVWESKSRMLAESGSLTLYKGDASFDRLGGFGAMKDFVIKSLESRDSDAKPRGVMLLGVPGSGKSEFCKAVGSATGLPVLLFDVGSCFGSLVGQTEANVRRALATADAMAPAILLVDEVEKALSGGSGKTQGDSGVSSRLLGSFLTWLSDSTSGVYTVTTCNDVEALPPEFSRAERFDSLFFCDLPSEKARIVIWHLYREMYGVEGMAPDSDGWTGAEIKSCCRIAKMLKVSLQDAARYIAPVSRTYGTKMDQLREWAENRCIDANEGGVYVRDTAPEKPATVRRVARRAQD